MNRPTLAMLRNSRASGAIGECAANLSLLRARVNEAQERLIMDPLAPDEGWFGGYARMAFNVTVANGQGYIVAPREVARIISLTVCNSPVIIRNSFYEFLAFGSGLRDRQRPWPQCQLEAFERDSVPTLTELTGTRTIHVFASDNADYGLTIHLQGLDANGKPVLRTDPATFRAVQGEAIELITPFAISVNDYSKVTGIMKPATLGEIQFYAYDSSTGASSALSTMAPGETVANYRRYFLSRLPTACLNGSSGTVQVDAQVKLDLVPVMSDSDYLTIQSIPALIEELMAMRYGEMDSPGASAKQTEHHGNALRLLFGQLDHYLGKVNTAITVPIFGSDRLQRQLR